jgi:beta-lactamase regulating signal transducer with metallopeptidase domain
MRTIELFVNLWMSGVPMAVIVWAVLRLTVNAPARLRYGIAVAGFMAMLVPWWSVREPGAALDGAAMAVADPVAQVLPVGWVAIAAILVLRDAMGHVRLRRARRALADAPAELKRALDWPASVPLLVSGRAMPYTAGLLRPAVVLPRDLGERFPMEVVQRIARHELSHARWRDPLVYAALRVVAAMFWAAPVWIVLRWVRRERESAADAFALRDAPGAEESYVTALVRFARPSRELAPAMAASDLQYRARRILARPRVSFVAVPALMLGAALFAVAAPVRLDAKDPVVVIERVVIRN